MKTYTVSSDWEPFQNEVGGIKIATFRDPIIKEIASPETIAPILQYLQDNAQSAHDDHISALGLIAGLEKRLKNIQ